MFDKFTERAKKVIQLARKESDRLNHDYIGTEHILLGIIKEGSGVGANVLDSLDLNFDKVRLEIEKLATPSPDVVTVGTTPFTPKAKQVIQNAAEEARQLSQRQGGHEQVGTEHILLGLVAVEEGIAMQALYNLGVSREAIRAEVMKFLGIDSEPYSHVVGGETGNSPKDPPQDQPTQEEQPPKNTKTPALDAFGRDLTKMAREGKLDPCIGRSEETKRIIRILARRRKNNPVLLGEAGVGKTAIVEGLAQAIASKSAPSILLTKRVVELDLALMVAGTKYRGQFEERMKAVLSEIRKSNNIILFVDELHTIVGVGGAEGSMDAANTLKPALARGEIQCIGATTLSEYRKHIEKDAALERRFQPVMVNEPNVEDSTSILRGLRKHYEEFHSVRIEDEALSEAVQLSSRYITSRFLPDKAIDVIDEAGARFRTESSEQSHEAVSMEEVLKKLDLDKEKAVGEEKFELASEYRDRAEELRAELSRIRAAAAKGVTLGIVTADDVREVVSNMTGIPLRRMESQEKSRLLQMEVELHKSIVSQDEAIGCVSRAIRRARAGLKDPRRPMASLLFLGPTGGGKTLLAQALAEFMFGDKDSLIRVDMSEYMEKHSVSRLIGAPPGYVGYEEGGQLTEKVRRRPYSVVLFDEIEKADSEVFNALLQIMEDGRLTDGLGRTVDFKNSIIIMTSNVGAGMLKGHGLGFAKQQPASSETIKARIKDEVDKTFRPEFLNRLDETVYFHQLTKDDIDHIVDLEFDKVAARLAVQDISLVLGDSARALLAEKGFSPEFGARPLRRAVEQGVEDTLSSDILGEKIKPGDTVTVVAKDGKLAFKTSRKKP